MHEQGIQKAATEDWPKINLGSTTALQALRMKMKFLDDLHMQCHTASGHCLLLLICPATTFYG